jgi:hypothetical protein
MNQIKAAQTDAWNLAKEKNPEQATVLRYRPSLREFLGDENYTKRLTIVWTFEPADEAGRPSDTQSADMKDFEDLLLRTLDPDRLAILAFVFTGSGKREWHFYLSDIDEVGIRINQALAKTPNLPIQLKIVNDPNWEELRQVYLSCGELSAQN